MATLTKTCERCNGSGQVDAVTEPVSRGRKAANWVWSVRCNECMGSGLVEAPGPKLSPDTTGTDPWLTFTITDEDRQEEAEYYAELDAVEEYAAWQERQEDAQHCEDDGREDDDPLDNEEW